MRRFNLFPRYLKPPTLTGIDLPLHHYNRSSSNYGSKWTSNGNSWWASVVSQLHLEGLRPFGIGYVIKDLSISADMATDS